jgi:hypothetical protein
MMPSWCRQINWGNCGIPWVNCAVLCVKDDRIGQFWGLRYCLSKLRSLHSFPSGMTSHSKIAQFNWESIAPLILCWKRGMVMEIKLHAFLTMPQVQPSAFLPCFQWYRKIGSPCAGCEAKNPCEPTLFTNYTPQLCYSLTDYNFEVILTIHRR